MEMRRREGGEDPAHHHTRKETQHGRTDYGKRENREPPPPRISVRNSRRRNIKYRAAVLAGRVRQSEKFKKKLSKEFEIVNTKYR